MDLMTVPTNNEDARAIVVNVLADLDYNDGGMMRWYPSGEPTKQAETVASRIMRELAPFLAARRLPVSGENAELIAWNHPDGTGPDSQPLYAATATGIADDDEAHLIRDMLRGRTDWRFLDHSRDRPGTWADILLEEVFDALAEDDPVKLRAELIQVSAVAAQWAEAIDRRTA